MKVRATLVGLGSLLMLYALFELLTGGKVTAPLDSGKWVIGAALTHDLVLAPIVATVGLLLTRLAPTTIRPVVAGGLIATGCLVLVSIPVLLDRGGQGNVTTTPLNYPRGLAVAVGVVVVVTAVTAGVRAAQKRRSLTVQDSTSE